MMIFFPSDGFPGALGAYKGDFLCRGVIIHSGRRGGKTEMMEIQRRWCAEKGVDFVIARPSGKWPGGLKDWMAEIRKQWGQEKSYGTFDEKGW